MLKLKTLIDNVLSVFYPHSCVGCHNVLQQNEEHLCINCMLHLPETNYHLDHDNPLTYLFAGRVPVKEVASLMFFRKGNYPVRVLGKFCLKPPRSEVGRLRFITLMWLFRLDIGWNRLKALAFVSGRRAYCARCFWSGSRMCGRLPSWSVA